MCFGFIYNFSETFLIVRRIQRDVHVTYWLLWAEFNEALIFAAGYGKIVHASIKFYENPSSASRVVAWVQNGVTKLIQGC